MAAANASPRAQRVPAISLVDAVSPVQNQSQGMFQTGRPESGSGTRPTSAGLTQQQQSSGAGFDASVASLPDEVIRKLVDNVVAADRRRRMRQDAPQTGAGGGLNDSGSPGIDVVSPRASSAGGSSLTPVHAGAPTQSSTQTYFSGGSTSQPPSHTQGQQGQQQGGAIVSPSSRWRPQGLQMTSLVGFDKLPTQQGGGAGGAGGAAAQTSTGGSSMGHNQLNSLTTTPRSEPATEAPADPNAELRRRVLELHLALGGADYKAAAQQSLSALEQVIVLLRETVALARSVPLVPADLVIRHTDRFQLLFAETRQLLASHGIVQAAAPPFRNSSFGSLGNSNSASAGAAAGSATYFLPAIIGSPRVGPRSPPTNAFGESVRKENPNALLQSPPLLAATMALATSDALPSATQDPSEIYDISVLAGDSQQHGRDDDELLFLRQRLRELFAEKTALQASVEKYDTHWKRVAENISVQSDALRQHHEVVADELRWMQEQIETGVWLPGYDLRTGRALASSAPGSSSGGARPVVPRKPRSAFQSAADEALSPVPGAMHQSSSAEIMLHSPLAGQPAGGLTLAQEASSGGAGDKINAEAGAPSSANGFVVRPGDVPSQRIDRLDALYADSYLGRGVDFLWNAIDVVFKRDFVAAGGVAGSPQPRSPTSTTPVGAASASAPPTGGGGGGNASVGFGSKTPPAAGGGATRAGVSSDVFDAYIRFKTTFHSKILPHIEDSGAFMRRTVNATPLRTDYVANCLSAKLKPNSGVLKLLSAITDDNAVTALDLGGNYLGDKGLGPVLPLLGRLDRLVSLNLADNGIKNAGVRQLCAAVTRHPSIAHINLCHNPVGRQGGKDLLTLVSAARRITSIDVTGSQIEAILQQRIEQRALQNMSPPAVS